MLDYPVPIPLGFPRGPGLTLTDAQLRQALYFTKASHHEIDPGRIYWRGDNLLRSRYYKVLFEKRTVESPDEWPFRHHKEVLKGNAGSHVGPS